MVITEPGSWVGLGWRTGFPKLVQGSVSFAVVMPDGSSHEIVESGGVWKSVDSSYIVLDPVTRTATLKGGTRLTFGNTVGNTSYMTEMKDKNGNQIKATYLSWAATWAMNYLRTNYSQLAARNLGFDPAHFTQALAASYNFGTGNISGDPDKIDYKTDDNNYGSNILDLMECFK